MKKYIELLKAGGAEEVRKVPTEKIVTAPWTIYRCRFGCDTYGKSHCCPPNAPTWQETRAILDCFSYGLLFTCRRENSVTPLAVKTARELFIDGYYKALAFGAGPCKKCASCNPKNCNFPGQTVPAMEACGIDVFLTARLNGIEIKPLHSPAAVPTYVGLVLAE